MFCTSYLCNGQASNTQSVKVDRLIKSINLSLDNHYVFPDKAQKIIKFLQIQTKNKAYSSFSNDPHKLAKQIQADIYKIHRDPHMLVEFNPGLTDRLQGKIEPTEEEIMQSKAFWKENNYLFKKVELLPGNIGYLPLNGFVEHVEEAKPIIASALGFLANTSAIIIDLRENRGGYPGMVSQLESYFFKEKTRMNDLVNRSNRDTTFYYADPAKTDGLTLSMPIYILTSKKTFSAAEDFSYAMQHAKRAILVGEVTGGGAHPTKPFSVGQGFIISIPFARSLNSVTQTDWEGTGVIPDFKIEATKALLKAQELVFRDRQTTAKNEKERQKLEYLINALYVNNDLLTLPLDQFDQLTGTYGPLVIYRDGNKLYCKIADKVTELAHISKNLFVLDGNAHIEFIKDNTGNYSRAKIFVSDGDMFEEPRI
ncbi:interphotoreceptor retinoid-binding protein [Rufibacter glacialis]|nr:interphotoreceptor retinoid-binding protein [Rufibacter glacialis]